MLVDDEMYENLDEAKAQEICEKIKAEVMQA
jgi:hypothetical protein